MPSSRRLFASLLLGAGMLCCAAPAHAQENRELRPWESTPGAPAQPKYVDGVTRYFFNPPAVCSEEQRKTMLDQAKADQAKVEASANEARDYVQQMLARIEKERSSGDAIAAEQD